MRSNIVRLGGSLMGLAAAALLVLPVSVSAQTPNMTGTWALEVDVDGAISNPSLVLVQDGMTLTGHYSSQTLGEADVTGTVEGNVVTVTFEASAGGLGGVATYDGTVDAEGVWSGNFDLAGLASGTFSATKSAP